MVLVDGRPSYGCTRTLDSIAGKDVVTVEGLGNSQTPHPLQRAFLAEQAGQCGFCLSGMLISAAALLEIQPGAGRSATCARRWKRKPLPVRRA